MRQLLLSAGVLLCLGGVVTAQFSQCICVMTEQLNVRAGPGTEHEVVGEVIPNQCMISTDSCPNGWCQVIFDGDIAYTSHSYVSGPQICADRVSGTCFDTHCGSGGNTPRTCDAQGCGYYGAPRGSRTHGGTDVACSAEQTIWAPFDGYMNRAAPPYGDGSCCDDGFEYEATDSIWDGFSVKVFYAYGYTVGGSFNRNERIATHIGLHCGCYSTSMTDHSHVELWKDGIRIDPTSFLYCDFA